MMHELGSHHFRLPVPAAVFLLTVASGSLCSGAADLVAVSRLLLQLLFSRGNSRVLSSADTRHVSLKYT